MGCFGNLFQFAKSSEQKEDLNKLIEWHKREYELSFKESLRQLEIANYHLTKIQGLQYDL